MTSIGTVVSAVLILAALGTAPRAQVRAQGGGVPCDRACLIGIADAYFAGLAAHDPTRAPMAPGARFTEQAQGLAVGGGLWKTTTEAPTTFKIYVPDPVSGQLGAIVMLKESGKPIQLALRLKVQNRQIVEAEHLIARPNSESSLANLQAVRPGLLATVPAAERLPRDVMLLFGHAYYDSLEQSDGDAVPFADDCLRRENGMTTAGPPSARAAGAPAAPPAAGANSAPGGARGGRAGGGFALQGCREQLNTRAMSYITSIDLRRVWIADPEKGLVFGLSMFRHPMESKTITVINADGSRAERAVGFAPFDLPAAHIFKIQGAKIHDIEAMGFQMPLYSKNGWSEFLR